MSDFIELRSPRHLDTAIAERYVDGDSTTVAWWTPHLEQCMSCACLVRLLMGPTKNSVPRLYDNAYIARGNVIQLSNWPLDSFLQLSPENVGNPALASTIAAVETMFEQRWTAQGLHSECGLMERIHRDDVVLVALEPDGRPQGAIFGRLSRFVDPSFTELGDTSLGDARSINFYCVVVDEEFRYKSIGVKLLLAAARHFTHRCPNISVRTSSPLVGLRSFISSWIESSPHQLETLLHDTQLSAGGFEHIVGVDPVTWLHRGCQDPQAMLASWQDARTRRRAAMSVLIQLVAAHYACDVWKQDTTKDQSLAVLACYVSHFHLRNGARFVGVRSFSRCHDPDIFYATAAFEYPTRAPEQVQCNRNNFTARQQENTLRKASGE